MIFDRHGIQVFNADCLNVISTLDAESIDAIVTDPPAGIGFMGREWDDFRRSRNPADTERENQFGRLSARGPEYARGPRAAFIEFITAVMRECHRVLKPGGHAVVWAIPRTSHWTATAVEDADFEIRDICHHIFGSGFPKSLDVSKAIDKALGVDREDKFEGSFERHAGPTGNRKCDICGKWLVSGSPCECPRPQDEPQTDAAKRWDGWGTALKPAAEHWILARKPLIGTVIENVQAHGTGAIHIDACRIATGDSLAGGAAPPMAFQGQNHRPFHDRYRENCSGDRGHADNRERQSEFGMTAGSANDIGRFPANLILDEKAGAIIDEQVGPQVSGGTPPRRFPDKTRNAYGDFTGEENPDGIGCSSGNVSRFFYCAKASTSERGEGNSHPTVKPIALMRWLCRLVTPAGGLILDPFFGSGSTGIAAFQEGFRAIGIERESEYFAIAVDRIKRATAQGVLFQ